jgi:uncharacterized protein (DUF2147 family)
VTGPKDRLLMTQLSMPLLVLGLMTLAMTSSPAWAGDPTGMWLSQDGDVKMKVARCGDAICSTIAWLKNPNDEKAKPKVDLNNADASKRSRPIMGSAIILPMKADGADKWSGQVYNAEDGKTYGGSFSLSGANKADLKGCVAIICKTKTWTRTN